VVDHEAGEIHLRFSALTYLAEAAVHCGLPAELQPRIDALAVIADTCPSPVLHRGLAYARALLAPADEAAERFSTALAGDLADWPFDRARIQLAYGSWVRRQGGPTDARALLRSAAGTFEAVGAAAWARRAHRELRASGSPISATSVATTSGATDPPGRLTAQELQVARLAAAGLRNREIAEKLFLSPRTVTTHLTRIFPKLGITSRRELAEAIAIIDPPVT
jgi:DNA-binding CsgD family transcriptional regulator